MFFVYVPVLLLVIKLLWFSLHSYPCVSVVARDGGVLGESRQKHFYGVNFEFLVFQSKIFKKNIMLTLFLIYGENAILEEEYYINYVKGRRQQISPEFRQQ